MTLSFMCIPPPVSEDHWVKKFLPSAILESCSFATSRRVQGPISSEMLLKELEWQAHGENKKNTAIFL